jgi:hypothetical protein
VRLKPADKFREVKGVRRLALGAFMIGERSDRGTARIGGSPFAPEELRPDQQASAATRSEEFSISLSAPTWFNRTAALAS